MEAEIPKLYGVAGSHPVAAVERALVLKGIPYKRADLPPGFHAAAQKLRFGERTVPGLVWEGRKLSGSRAIMRALDEAVPEPLYPADPAARARVEEAELWGDEVLQSGARRLAWCLTPRAGREALTLQEDERSPVRLPAGLARFVLPLLTPVEHRLNGVSADTEREDLAALPGWIDRVDELIAEGVLGAEPFPNAADLQIGASVRLMLVFGDLAAQIEGRPAAEHATQAIPRFPGKVSDGLLRN